MVRRMRYLPVTPGMPSLLDEMLRHGVVPRTKATDAAHLAISTTQGIDFLLTWNYAHLANPSAQTQLGKLCDRLNLMPPLMVSPESIPQVRFGQSIRRKR